MINAQLDDQNCKILLKGIENKSKDLSKATKTIAVDLRTSNLIRALYELR